MTRTAIALLTALLIGATIAAPAGVLMSAEPIQAAADRTAAQIVGDTDEAVSAAIAQRDRTIATYEDTMAKVGWGAAILGGLMAVVKVGARLPFVPAPVRGVLEVANGFLPGLTGPKAQRAEKKYRKAAEAGVEGVEVLLNLLRKYQPQLEQTAIGRLKIIQEALGTREIVRDILAALRLSDGPTIAEEMQEMEMPRRVASSLSDVNKNVEHG
jgi:hypothetical protein